MLSRLYNRNERGFTLIELLVVVVVIAILAAIAIPIFIDQTKLAVDASVKSDVRNTVNNLNGWRASNNAQLPASSAQYIEKGGVLATSKGAYINVSFSADSNYTVCGYNHGGSKYTDYKHSWVFTSNNGQFNAYTNGDCVNALNYDPSNPSDPTTDPTDPTTPPGTTKDPQGSYPGTDPSNPTDPTDPTDPGNGGNPGGGNPPAGGSRPVTSVCNVTDDAQVKLVKGDPIPNLPEAYISAQGLKAEAQITLSDDQKTIFNRQAADMKAAMNWYKELAKANPSATSNADWAHKVANADNGGKYYFSNASYNGDYDQPEANSGALLKMHVYVWANGDSFAFYIGQGPQNFEAQWDYDVQYANVDVDGATVKADKSILNTDGNQTTGYYRTVTAGSDSYKQYSPECGQTQKFGYNAPTSDDPNPGGDPGPGSDPTPTSTPLTMTSYNWMYSFDGPTAADEVAKKGDYPSMCYFDRNDPSYDNVYKWQNGNELCRLNTGDGTANPDFGTQLIGTSQLDAADFPSDGKLVVDGDFNFINGTYQCSAGDGVHVISKDTNIFTNEIIPYGPQSRPGYNYARGGTRAYDDLDVTDYWSVSTYEQCDTTTKTARVLILLTYPEDITRGNGNGGGGHNFGGAVFNYQNKQYRISVSSGTRFNRNDIFDRDHRALIQYVPNTWTGQQIYLSCSNPGVKQLAVYSCTP